jgi:antagonist of KipI
MQITIIKPGMLSTIQDMGRNGYLSQAVPVSGAMDMLSARIANIALGNAETAAVIEFTYADAEFEADTDILIAYAGDGAILTSRTGELPPERPLFIPARTVLRFTNNPAGCRTYLSVAGGWDVPEVMGSRSTYVTAAFGGLNGRTLQSGDSLVGLPVDAAVTEKLLNSLKGNAVNYPHWSAARKLLLADDKKTIRVVPAHEFNWFDGQSVTDFLSEPYTLTMQSNRMGYHLAGAAITHLVQQELLSTAVTPGTIQVTGEGGLVLLMADCQTTGGYPRIAQVAAADMPLCGQLKPGDVIYFNAITRREAELLYLKQEHDLHKLSIAIKNKYS